MGEDRAERAGRVGRMPLVGGLVLLVGLLVGAIAPSGEPATEAPETATVAERREELAREVEALRRGTPPLEAAERNERLTQLEALDRVLLLVAEASERSAELTAKANASPATPEIENALVAGPPYPLATLDLVLDAAETQRRRRRELDGALTAAESALEAATSELEKSERARRRLREELDGAAPGAAAARLRRQVAERELAARILRAEIELRQQERSNAKASVDLVRRDLAWREEAADTVWHALRPGPSEVSDRIAELDKQRFDLDRSLAAAKLDQDSADRRWKSVQRRLESAADPGPVLQAELAARRAELTQAERAVTFIEAQRARLDRVAEAWQQRAALASGEASRDEQESWLLDARQSMDAAERESRLARVRLIELRQELDSVHRGAQTSGAGEARWLGVKAASLEGLIGFYEAELASLEALGRSSGRVVAAIERDRSHLDFGERLAALRGQAKAVWSTEISSSQDRPITVGKIVTALLVFVLGWLAARTFAGVLGSRVFPRLSLDEGAANAFESLSFYFLIVVVFLMTLRTVNIPLTAFAVVGGALAIGIGFGSQNVVSNFISGLILLAERPIKRGDLVEVDGTYGNVEHIGLRSTRIRSGDNIHIIVPNAAFLEGKVINWTHNDLNVRVRLSVGVVYGAPTREVERLIGLALKEHPKVQETPTPIILFKSFGDNALEFEAAFWVRMRSVMERLKVESDIRYRIDDLFREAEIVIAFPQRDVHLDTLRPLEVRMVPPGPDPDPGSGA